jgi:hypothetical protein
LNKTALKCVQYDVSKINQAWKIHSKSTKLENHSSKWGKLKINWSFNNYFIFITK